MSTPLERRYRRWARAYLSSPGVVEGLEAELAGFPGVLAVRRGRGWPLQSSRWKELDDHHLTNTIGALGSKGSAMG